MVDLGKLPVGRSDSVGSVARLRVVAHVPGMIVRGRTSNSPPIGGTPPPSELAEQVGDQAEVAGKLCECGPVAGQVVLEVLEAPLEGREPVRDTR